MTPHSSDTISFSKKYIQSTHFKIITLLGQNFKNPIPFLKNTLINHIVLLDQAFKNQFSFTKSFLNLSSIYIRGLGIVVLWLWVANMKIFHKTFTHETFVKSYKISELK